MKNNFNVLAYEMRTQKSPAEFGFDRYDKGRLKNAMKKVCDKRTYLRLQAVSLVAQGMSINEVSRIVNKSLQIIYVWITAFLKQHRVEALFDASKSGRPLSAPGITDKRILRELRLNPLKLGYYTTTWTVALLANHLSNRYGTPISPFTLYRRMKKMGLRCKRPRYVYSEKEPNRAQKKGRLSES
ncbi:winged helix-turn-helix domain-containing protein [Paraflavisolibacter sp. H34]|uniref:helix-turn-helix domain-containing protein n=1 Tax=Huijunlia imazamoxiresistens TaxID=3127457 RepID=UPI003018D217